MLEALLLSFSLAIQSGAGGLPPSSSLISAIPCRNINFAQHGDRWGEVAVYENNPKIFYICSCNGGVMKTVNGGIDFKFVFDKVGSASIGSIAVSQKNPDVLWVGTGDKWQRNTVGMGDGIYKTTDGGKTWQDMGLKNSNAIGKIVIDPKNEDIVMVAALGSPWGYGPDRGIYKTTDGGKNWRKVLYTNEKSAGNDVNIDPKNSKNMLATLYDHIHYPYGWYFGGPGSGIYRSTDGGETWRRTKGLTEGKLGRIFVGYCDQNPKLAAAFVEEDPQQGSGFYRSWDGGETWKMMPALDPETKKRKHWSRPYYNDFEITFHPTNPDIIFLGGVNCRTEDGGQTIMGGRSDSHGSWVNPKDPKHWIDSGDVHCYQGWNFQYGNKREFDKTYIEFKGPCIFQTFGCGYDMRKLYWVMGNSQDDGAYTGPTQSMKGVRDGTETMSIYGHEAGRSMADPEDWTTIYAQGPGYMLHRVDLKTGRKKDLLNWGDSGDYDFVEANKQYLKLNPRIRTNRFPPFEISPWNSKTLYFGTNVLMKSTDRGDHWEHISPDLTHNKPEWQVPDEGSAYVALETSSSGEKCYQTINTIAESPMKPNMIWVGTDDGYVWLTKDGGKKWDNLTKNITGLPEYSWCSRIEASKFVEGRAYATFDNRHWFDHKSYVYVTEDYGQTWTKISSNMKDEPCRVIREGLKNPDLLFVGTEFGLWASLDRGKSWDYYQDWTCEKDHSYPRYFPRIAVHDLQIHPREDDLIIASHGRGIWIMSIKPLEEMTAENRAKDVYFTTPGNVYLFPMMGADFFGGRRDTDNTQPGTLFSYYLKQEMKGSATIRFQDALGNDLVDTRWGRTQKFEIQGCPLKAGLNSVRWIVEDEEVIKKPGDYRVILTIDGKEYFQKLHVEDATDEVLAGMKAIYPKVKQELADKRD